MRRGYWRPHTPPCFIYNLIGIVDLLYKHQTIKQIQTHELERHSIAFYRVRIPCYTYKVINEEKPRITLPNYKNLQIKQQLGRKSICNAWTNWNWQYISCLEPSICSNKTRPWIEENEQYYRGQVVSNTFLENWPHSTGVSLPPNDVEA